MEVSRGVKRLEKLNKTGHHHHQKIPGHRGDVGSTKKKTGWGKYCAHKKKKKRPMKKNDGGE